MVASPRVHGLGKSLLILITPGLIDAVQRIKSYEKQGSSPPVGKKIDILIL
jgi:hypothetical protein